jgi:hypothetical protein
VGAAAFFEGTPPQTGQQALKQAQLPLVCRTPFGIGFLAFVTALRGFLYLPHGTFEKITSGRCWIWRK